MLSFKKLRDKTCNESFIQRMKNKVAVTGASVEAENGAR